MNSRKHIYYITISDVQHVAKESIGRVLNPVELAKVTDKVLDRIQWFDVLEEAIVSVAGRTNHKSGTHIGGRVIQRPSVFEILEP